MEQIKINSIEQLKNNENYVYYDKFENIDARGIDLSNFPSNNIEDIENCNLENTGLKIFLNDNSNEYFKEVAIADSNIIGTQFVRDEQQQDNSIKQINIYLHNVILDKNQIQYLNDLYQKKDIKIYYDLNTILNNDEIVIDSFYLMRLLRNFLHDTANTTVFKEDDLHNIVEKIEKVILKDKVGDLKAIYDNIAEQLSDCEKLIMFRDLIIQNATFKNLEVNEEMYNILRKFDIKKCNLENVVFKNSLNSMFYENYDNSYHGYNSVENTKMPNINYDNWRDIKYKRINRTPFTFRTNLYLELGRCCNAKCFFCRNGCMEKCKYSFKNIINTLNQIIDNIDSIFIGGGEPTINKKDLQKLLDIYLYQGKDIYTVSNGSATLEFYKNLESSIYISRHHFDDNINADIFGLHKKKILSMDDLAKLHNLTLTCTCINGGIDSVDKIIQYLQTADLCGVRNIVFSNLHDDASVNTFDSSYKNLNVKKDLFDEAIDVLKRQGFYYNYPIVSSGGYKMYMLRHNILRPKIAFKQYLSKEELENLWLSAVKRTFDLSIAPDGSLYENWAQDGHKVKILK